MYNKKIKNNQGGTEEFPLYLQNTPWLLKSAGDESQNYHFMVDNDKGVKALPPR